MAPRYQVDEKGAWLTCVACRQRLRSRPVHDTPPFCQRKRCLKRRTANPPEDRHADRSP